MTDVKSLKDLISSYKPQDSRKKRATKQEGLDEFSSYIRTLQQLGTPFQVVYKRSQNPLSLSVIHNESEELLLVFTLYDTSADEAIACTEGVYFYAY